MKLNAIVLHSIRYGDNDLIAYLYTLQHGRQTCVVRGGRRGRHTAMVQPLFLLEIEAQPPRRASGMGLAREIRASPPLADIAGSIAKTAVALFMSETLYRFVREEEANPPLYSFLEGQIMALEQIGEGAANFHLYFLANLARHLGFLPGNTYDARSRCLFDLHTGCFADSAPPHEQYLDARTALLLWQMLCCQPCDLRAFALCRTERAALASGLLHYYSYHLGMPNPVRSLAVLSEVFA